MDTDQKLINAVKALLDVVEELASGHHDLSEESQAKLDQARRQMKGARSKRAEDARS